MRIDTTGVASQTAPYELVQRMRASIKSWGPGGAFRAGPRGHARGCNLGPRKIDIHLRGLTQLGAEIKSDHGFVEVKAPV